MDGLFPPWLIVLSFAAAGSGTFLVIHPYKAKSFTREVFGSLWTFIAGSAAGMAFTFSICEYTGFANPYYQWSAAYVIGLTGITICRTIVLMAESEGMAIISRAIKRMLGVPENDNRRDHIGTD